MGLGTGSLKAIKLVAMVSSPALAPLEMAGLIIMLALNIMLVLAPCPNRSDPRAVRV